MRVLDKLAMLFVNHGISNFNDSEIARRAETWLKPLKIALK